MQQNTKPLKQIDYRYLINESGEIFSLFGSRGLRKKPKKIKTRLDKKGYVQATVFLDNGKRYCTRIHRLVASAFLEMDLFDKNLTVHHKDKNRSNNQISNLEVVSAKTHFSNHTIENRKKDKNNFTQNEKNEIAKIKQNQIDDFMCALGVVVEN